MNLIPSTLSRISRECACLNARSAARVLTKYYDSCLAPAELKMTQFSVLATIAAHDSVAISKLARALELDRTTLTRSLSLLEHSGLVLLTTGADVRSKDVRLSPRGEAALTRALPLWEKAQGVVRNSLDYDALMQQFLAVTQKENVLV